MEQSEEPKVGDFVMLRMPIQITIDGELKNFPAGSIARIKFHSIRYTYYDLEFLNGVVFYLWENEFIVLDPGLVKAMQAVHEEVCVAKTKKG